MHAAITAMQLLHDDTAVRATSTRTPHRSTPTFKKTRPHGCQLLGSARALTIAKSLGSSRSRVYTGAGGIAADARGQYFLHKTIVPLAAKGSVQDHEKRTLLPPHDKQDGKQEEESDFIDVLLSVRQQKYYDGITREQIKAILMDMFAAGTDTSSFAEEASMAEIKCDPRVMTKLQAEVRNNTPKGQDLVEEENLANMTYLKAVVKETLRLHPPLPLLIPHLSKVESEVDVAGYTVPSGAWVMVNSWAINRDPEWWEKPEEFLPERFMEGGSASAVDFMGNDFQFLSFGAGRRICPGINFGLATIEIMLANLVYSHDWELSSAAGKKGIDMREVFRLSVRRKEKLMLVPKNHSSV
ncbi:indole-2-monooxygenase-like [Triticum dicoccoides]|uniref:indole-2-monooxygenase-like n=1 Tax=Triticum dicoccoides TaxID=85692 RepID=UPI00188E2B39|nr:indole-2-monooxygenase-like [Triticum dicoccoides]